VLAKSLPYGPRRLLEIARALATRPKLLFLDEPAAGMSEEEIDRVIDLVHTIQKRGVTLLLVEHRMRLVMNVAEHIIVLSYGRRSQRAPLRRSRRTRRSSRPTSSPTRESR